MSCRDCGITPVPLPGLAAPACSGDRETSEKPKKAERTKSSLPSKDILNSKFPEIRNPAGSIPEVGFPSAKGLISLSVMNN